MEHDLTNFKKVEDNKYYTLYVEKGPYKDTKIRAIIVHKETGKSVCCVTSSESIKLLTDPKGIAKKLDEKQK